MNLHALAGLAFVFGATASQAANLEPTGTNCALFVPPNDAGESPDHDIYFRVYPRAAAITSTYTGCQILWAPHVRNWSKISVTVIANGDPVRLWLPAQPADPVNACRYEKGRVVGGDAHSCPAPQFLIQRSLPAGCTAQIREAEGGPVPGCEFE